MTTLTSKSNPRLKQIRLLRQRKARLDSGLFLVEGIRHVGEAIESGAQVEYFCYAPEQLTSAFAINLIRQQELLGVPCLAVATDVFATLADKENPQGILAVVRQPQYSLEGLSPHNFPWGVALVAPQDPGNIGAILRTIDAVGASGLLLLEQSADAYHPNAVRASMGSLLRHPVVKAGYDTFVGWARRWGYSLYGTSAHGSLDYRHAGLFKQPCILVLGSERQGLSPEQAAACDELLRVPMHGKVTSLNLAVAAGVMLYRMLEDFQGD
jgi:TrmH family RNA methyltransferase